MDLIAAEFTNTFGTVYAEKFIIHKVEDKIINIDNIRKVRLVKKRNYRKNLFFILLSVFAAIVCHYLTGYRSAQMASAGITFMAVMISMLIVEHQFKFMIIRRYDVSEFPTEKESSDAAQELALLINKKIRDNAKLNCF